MFLWIVLAITVYPLIGLAIAGFAQAADEIDEKKKNISVSEKGDTKNGEGGLFVLVLACALFAIFWPFILVFGFGKFICLFLNKLFGDRPVNSDAKNSEGLK
ncbi:MAG: hypothetical protein AAB345_03675 [Patescibacteria group bacterium]